MAPLSQLPPKAWDASFDLNVGAAYLCTRAVGDHMIGRRSGAIVNISSNTGIPLRRPVTPEEVANAVVFLASDAASYIGRRHRP